MDPPFASQLRSKLRKLSVVRSEEGESDFEHGKADDPGPGADVKSRKRDKLLSFLKKKDTPWITIGAVSFSSKLFTSYKYAPVGDYAVRILDILPTSEGYLDAAVYCKLREYRLELSQTSHTADYGALSYAWGPTNEDGCHLIQKVICDGHTLPVTANLHAALKRIRQNILERQLPQISLWVIALCIKQRDDDERNRQVGMMYQIYRQTSLLYLWLGNVDKTLTANLWSTCSLGVG